MLAWHADLCLACRSGLAVQTSAGQAGADDREAGGDVRQHARSRARGGRAVRLGLAWGLALVIGLGQGLPAYAQKGQSMSREDYEACQSRDEAGFRDAIERVTVKALESSIRGLDYQPIVADEWRRGGIDEIMAKRVDAVLNDLRQETSWGELLSSLASREMQEKLAKSAAERVYRADDMKRAIEVLAVGVGSEVGRRLELATSDAAEPTTRCLEAFLGPRYGATVAKVVATDAGREFAIDASKGTAAVSRGSMLVEGKEGMAGLVALIMRRQIGNLSARIGQRIAGAVLGRVVSVVAGGIGVVLIAKDVWELRHGVLPIIATEMKAPATRDKVQAELAGSIATEIGGHVRTRPALSSPARMPCTHDRRPAALRDRP